MVADMGDRRGSNSSVNSEEAVKAHQTSKIMV